jgi:hypothetical protein
MGIRNTDKDIALAKDVSFMPPELTEVALELDSNFVGGFKYSKDPDSKPGSPGITSVDDFEYNPAWEDANTKIDYTMPFTKAELLAKWQEKYTEYNSKVYKLDREVEYPQLGEQLDALFHDIDDGKLDKTGSFYTLLKEVKDTYPKA